MDNGQTVDFAILKPPWELVICSLPVLASSIVFFSVGLASFAAWDPCTLIGGIILIGVSAAVAWEQYRGVYRRHSRAAFRTAIYLFLIGIIATLILGELLVSWLPIPWKSLFLPALGIAAIAYLAGSMNLRWSRRLSRAHAQGIQSRSRIGLFPRERWIGVGALTCVALLTTYFIRITPPRCAEHVSRKEAPFELPPGAHDVSYCHGARGTISFEFTTDEQSFAQWVNSGIGSLESVAANHSVKEITSPIRIEQYHSLAPGSERMEYVVVENGLSYEWSKEDRGVYATFDRTTGRAYYHAYSY